MKIHHISDTHSCESQLKVPADIDLIIFSGDATNYRDREYNYQEAIAFFDWYESLNIKYKIFVAGNHDISIYHKLITRKEIESRGIIYLENEDTTIENLKIWGSPYSPTFGNWVFMKSRTTINRVWQHIPDDTDILITHTPSRGILDLTEDYDGTLRQVGCSALLKRVMTIQPLLHCFGHIHSSKNIINAGYTKLSTIPTIFSNGSTVRDGYRNRVSTHGNTFTL